MHNFDEIKNMWQNHTGEKLPSISDLNRVINNYHSNRRRTIIFTILLAVICLIVMVWVMVDYDASFLTTRLGESLFVLLSLYLFFSKLRLLKRTGQEELLNTKDYLDDLKTRSKKKAVNESRSILYIVLSIAFALYLYEILSAYKINLLIGYGVLGSFLLFMWVIYRPMMIKKKQSKIQTLLNHIDHIKNQANEEN